MSFKFPLKLLNYQMWNSEMLNPNSMLQLLYTPFRLSWPCLSCLFHGLLKYEYTFLHTRMGPYNTRFENTVLITLAVLMAVKGFHVSCTIRILSAFRLSTRFE